MDVKHPFQRYEDYTDLKKLLHYSSLPLRKCLRVNTLKCSNERVAAWGRERGWSLESVPWCNEGFFIEREDRSQALGKDLLQLTGGFYIQEASSMLPPAILCPKPGETVMDMAAAPGSKTSQMAAMMQNKGTIIANDVQETRLWTLKAACHRLGVANTIVTKKVGQWFAKHMTERFDAILCDAPCTAQGTVRKDSDALRYCSQESIEKMARLQVQLLSSAIHALKVGGRVVYSTCTLTPEENEGVIAEVLSIFGDQVSVLHPGLYCKSSLWMKDPIFDSHRVQESMGIARKFEALRLWPQTFDSEGFFAVLLEKRAPTKDPEQMDIVPPQEILYPEARMREIGAALAKLYGTDFLDDGDRLWQREDQLMLLTKDASAFSLPLEDYALGLPFCKVLPDKRVRISHELVTLRGNRASQATLAVTQEQCATLLKGQDITCDAGLYGDLLLFFEGICIGRGLAKNGILKNNLPRTMVLS